MFLYFINSHKLGREGKNEDLSFLFSLSLSLRVLLSYDNEKINFKNLLFYV